MVKNNGEIERRTPKHLIVYGSENEYCAWPSIARAGNGEILVSFCRTEQHIAPNGQIVLVRSKDNGMTWSKPEIIYDTVLDDRQCGLTPLKDGRIMAHFTSCYWTREEYEKNWFRWVSPDMQKRWLATVDDLDMKKAKACEGSWTALLDAEGRIGAPPMHGPESIHGGGQLSNGALLVASYIGGQGAIRVHRAAATGEEWREVASIPSPQPDRFRFGEPHIVALPTGRVIMMVRVSTIPFNDASPLCVLWETYSDDDGQTWAKPFPTPLWGLPPHLALLSDGRVLATYGYRRPPYGQRACISQDGLHWDLKDEIILRDDAPNGDLGYPVSLEIEPGRILTVYYQVNKPQVSSSLEYSRPAGEKPAILATLWTRPERDGQEIKSALLKMKDPVIVSVSPPKYGNDPSGKWWGFYQFPDLWRGNDGVLYLAVNVGADSTVGEHEPTLFFSSKDSGRTWQTASLEDMDLSPQPIRLPDGSEVAFDEQCYLYHVQALTSANQSKTYSAKKLGLKPISGPILSPYKVTENVYYYYKTVPESLRRFPVAWRRSSDVPWQRRFGIIDMPDLILTASARDRWWDKNGKFEWTEKGHEFTLPIPKDPETILALPDGTLLWALASQNPKVMDRRCGQVTCLDSKDHGQTWHMRGYIANDTTRTTWGYVGEQSLTRMPDGGLLCVMRTKCSNEANDTHYLAAARSTDNGFTWSTPVPIAEFSVTPHLLCLKNGIVALIYGRPGVHVKISTDSGRTWSESVPLIGPSEKELLAMSLPKWWSIRHNFSCANTSVVVTGPDRFLVAYSDFRYVDAAGQTCKAIKVQEVTVTPAGEKK